MKEEVQRTLQDAMTVRMLIEYLEDCDPDSPVLFACDYGDYHHTQQALLVTECEEAEPSRLVDSAYSRSGLALDDGDGTPQFWCEKCEAERVTPRCKCGQLCVDEEGEPADEDNDSDESIPVVILK